MLVLAAGIAGGTRDCNLCPAVPLLSSPWHWCKLKHSSAGSALLAFHSPTTTAKKKKMRTRLSSVTGEEKTSHRFSPLHHMSHESVDFYMPSGAGTLECFVEKIPLINSDFLSEPSSNTCKGPLE